MLTGHLNRRLLDLLDEGHRLNLSQAVQVLINCVYFEDAVPVLERQLSQARCGRARAASTPAWLRIQSAAR